MPKLRFSETDLLRTPDSFVPFLKTEIEQSLPIRFQQQARRRPDKTAIKTTTESLTYSDLNRVANQIAHAVLTAAGKGNKPVALLIERDALIIAAILGVLKAGKIYVPLDPADSPSRNNNILLESQARLLLTDNSTYSQVGRLWSAGVPFVNLDELDPATSVDDPDLNVPPDSLAYIFYTSGSTGRPKGLADTHRNVLHNIMRYTNSLQIAPDDRLTLLQSCTFSGSVSSLFCALLNGSTSFPFSLRREGPKRLVSWLADEEITIYHSVPSIFRLIATGERNFPALRIIRLEGDQARPKDIELYKTHFPDSCNLVNGLGATECGLVRQFFVDKSTPTPESMVPIGYAVEDMRILLLNESGQEVGLNSVGEIAVESRYLAQGYWRRPDLTEAAFLPHSSDPGKSIYRTGDLGRMQPDGCLDYLGRKNFQLKIRGLWVEVAAVEKALHEFGYFEDARVYTYQGADSEPILVAYLVPIKRPAPVPSAIRRYMAKRLPEHMVPSSYVFLDRLPLNANGKIERQALPIPGHTRPDTDIPFIPPQNMLQLQLQQIWEEVLHIHPIGMKDDFFDLGGDSLQAMIMMVNVERATEKEIPPEVILTGPTIDHLADYIQSENERNQHLIVEVQKGEEMRAFYFLHGDYVSGGFYSLKLARSLGAGRPFYVLPPCGKNGHRATDSYQEMATVHLQALRAQQTQGPYMLGGTCNGGLVALEMARQLMNDGEEVDLLILIAASASNLRFRWLKRMLLPLRYLGPNRAQYESRLFGHLNWFLKKLKGKSPRQYPQFIRRKMLKVVEGVRYILRGAQLKNPDRKIDGIAGNARDEFDGAQPTLYEIYRRIDQEYMPEKYPGKVTLFWANGESESPEEAVRWWRMTAGKVELYAMPGSSHQESLTAHAGVVAAMLRSCMEQVEAHPENQ